MVYHILQLPRSPQTTIDPEFWERLRENLKAHMKEMGLKQKELAPKLGIDPTTLNNFLNHQSNALNGLAVALACTFIDLACGKVRIGRIPPVELAARTQGSIGEQLVLEFDKSFEIQRGAERPTLVLRKSPSRREIVRLSVRRLG